MLEARSPSWFNLAMLKLGDIEVFVGLLLAAFVFLVVIGIGGGIILAQEWPRLSMPMKSCLGLGYAALMICEVRSLGWITHGLQVKHSPRAVWLAMSLRERGFPGNAMLAAWWLVHLAAILTAGIMLDIAISSLGKQTGDHGNSRLAAPIAGVLALFFATYMSSSFLVLAVGSLCRRETLLRKVWRIRALIDAVVVIGIVLVQNV